MNNIPSQNLQKFYKEMDDAKKDARNKNLYEFIVSRVKGERVLDIGSGTGHFLNKLKQSGFEAEGAEPDKKLIKIGDSLYNNEFKVHALGAEDIGQIKGVFDTIVMIDVLEHIEYDGLVLAKIKDKLVKNGRLVIFVPAYQFLYSQRDKQIGHFRRYSAGALKAKIEAAGFKVHGLRYWNMVGFFVYLFFEKILKKHASGNTLRTGKKNGMLGGVLHRALDLWMGKVENNINLGFGLSVLCVAEKRQK